MISCFFQSHQHTQGLATRASQVNANEARGTCHRVCCFSFSKKKQKGFWQIPQPPFVTKRGLQPLLYPSPFMETEN